MNHEARHHRRIDWRNYASAGPVRITNTQTGETRIERALHPAEVKRIVAEGHFLSVPKKVKHSGSKGSRAPLRTSESSPSPGPTDRVNST